MRVLSLEEMNVVAGGTGCSKPKRSKRSKSRCGGSSSGGSSSSSSGGSCTTTPPPAPSPGPGGGN